MSPTTISWTDETWPITVGCDQVSPGCKHCYAMRSVHRVNLCQAGAGRPAPYAGLVELVQLGGRQVPRWTGDVGFFPERLAMPLAWRSPRKVFVASQSDIFHDKFTNEQIAAIFGVMAATPRHTYQVLTKRPARMRAWFEWAAKRGDDGRAMFPDDEPSWRIGQMLAWYLAKHGVNGYVGGTAATGYQDFDPRRQPWPLPNVWLGVSAEDQLRADQRIPELLDTPAAVRFISAEPLLERVVLWAYLRGPDRDRSLRILERKPEGAPVAPGLDWVILGCESGPGARPCVSEWLRSMLAELAAAGVPAFLKQARGVGVTAGAGSHRKGGGVIELPYLDGVQHAAFPEASCAS